MESEKRQSVSLFLFMSVFALTLAARPLLAKAKGPEGVTAIVSDLDDTIRISNSADKLKVGFNGLFTKKVFTGMATLVDEVLATNGSARLEPTTQDQDLFHVLSNSPRFLMGIVKSLLNQFNYPKRTVHLRSWLTERNKIAFKTKELKSIADDLPQNSSLLLWGDNVEYDPLVYTNFQTKNPTRVYDIYIRRVRREKPASKSVKLFYTAFDIAYSEVKAKRLKVESALKVAHDILKETRFSNIIPDFAVCPTEPPSEIYNLKDLATQDPKLIRTAARIWGKILKTCR